MPIRPFPQWGPRHTEFGAVITTSDPQLTSPIHHVNTVGPLTTLYPPLAILRDALQVILIADTDYNWDDTGNIAVGSGTTVCVGAANEFVYDRTTGKWYPIMGNTCLYRPQ